MGLDDEHLGISGRHKDALVAGRAVVEARRGLLVR